MAPQRQTPSNAGTRQVNNLLHTLRGEDFRHGQNLQRVKARSLVLKSYNNPTLPFDQIYAERAPESGQRTPPREPLAPVRFGPEGVLEYAYPRGQVPGPPPPRSWSGLFGKGKEKDVDEPTQRAGALSLMLSHLAPATGTIRQETLPTDKGSVPPLTLLCLQHLLSFYVDSDSADAFAEELVPCLPPHLRRDLLRWSAVCSPLPSSKLYALCEPDGHTDGELIIVGPQASLSRDFLKTRTERHTIAGTGRTIPSTGSEKVGDEDWSWDSPSANVYTAPSLHTLILLGSPLPVNTLLSFPPTLTHLALLALPSAAPVHRLPRICPLIEVLDVSFNPWLKDSGGGEPIITRIEWNRWSRLRVLGLRGCEVSADIVGRINKGRWVDVEVVGVDSGDTDLELAMNKLHLNG